MINSVHLFLSSKESQLSQFKANSDLYPNDYSSSRQKFISAAEDRDAELARFPIADASQTSEKKGGDLSVDIALFGDRAARRTLFYISGTHGVEGFLGSAIQQGILSELSAPPKGHNLVLVHCLNPWGMANLRRGNANNVDLNRNCIDDDSLREGAPDKYEDVRTLLIPESSPNYKIFELAVQETIKRISYNAVLRAVASGQYVDKKGLFYGGDSLQPELEAVREWTAENLNRAEEVVAVDLHTGLGEFNTDALLVEYLEGKEDFNRVKRIFPDQPLFGTDPNNQEAYETSGGLTALLPPVLPKAQISFAVQEFGTAPIIEVLHALVDENFHHFNTADEFEPNPRKLASNRLKEIFCPSAPEWRERSVQRGLEIFRAASSYLNDK